ncbi:biotin transporter BioY [Demequina lutea]|uniref:Biotin transporter n=1 Tax=Demequina lutea TaxID=431489 RepID=A0A7Z0CI75_9MICO|nr:biotin transporter BioY [Demequina lutea]NYI41609.1 biotin transport system substrate-specific component [Demequina lutea]
MPIRHALSTTNIALIAVFAGLVAASTLWPGAELVSGVPITLQTLAILLAGAALGPWRGAAAVALYLVVGTAGAPIFAGRVGGFAAWAGPTAGFLGGFVLAAFVTGWLVRRMRLRGQLTTTGIIGACAVGSLVVLNLIGWGFFSLRLHTSLADTVTFASPFLAGDIIKVFVAGSAAAAVHRAYPQLLGSVRSTPSAADSSALVATGTSAGSKSGA